MCFNMELKIPDFKGELFHPDTVPHHIFRPSFMDHGSVWEKTVYDSDDSEDDTPPSKEEGYRVVVISSLDPDDQRVMDKLEETMPLEDFTFFKVVGTD